MSKDSNILILTPIKDAASSLESYFTQLNKLQYSKKLISLGFIEGDSTDGTYQLWQEQCKMIQPQFHNIGLWKRDYNFQIPRGLSRQDYRIQLPRRSILAKSRNYLLSKALKDEDFVLWLDVDVTEYPIDIIQTLLNTHKDIVMPNCVRQYGADTYDLNAWRNIGHRILHIHDLKNEGSIVPLDSVGGTMLLVKADLHREGLVFPTFPYGLRNQKIRNNNYWLGEIETEGFGIMAQDMGHQAWALPSVEIKHSMD